MSKSFKITQAERLTRIVAVGFTLLQSMTQAELAFIYALATDDRSKMHDHEVQVQS